MKNSVRLLSLLALAGGSVAVAAPRESLTLTNVPSIGRQGAAGNFITTLNATGADGGGSYNVASLSLTGTVGNFRSNSWPRETMILVTPPTGTPFVMAPGTIGTATTGPLNYANSTIPVSAVSTAGTWTFEFFDDYDDVTTSGTAASEATLGLYDALWSNVTIALDDAAPAAPAVGSGPSVTFTNVESDGTTAAPAQTRSWSNTTAFSPALPGLRIRGRVVCRTGNAAANLGANQPGNARISIVPPGGTAITPWSSDLAISSMGEINQVAVLPVATTLVGTWGFNFFEGADLAGVDNQWIDISFELVDLTPTAAVPVAVNSTGAWATATSTIASAGSVAWFTFTAPATLTSTGYLDIDTVGTSLSPSNDTDMALYLVSGTLVDSNEDSSVNLLSQLSYGAGNRRRVGNGLDFTNSDGSIAAASTTGIAPGATYYVAVAGGNAATHATGFATAGGANTGSVTLRIRAQDSGNIIELPTATSIPLTGGGAWDSASSTIANAGDLVWFTFTTPPGLAASGGLDIDTIGTSLLPTNDTEIALYTTAGVLVDSDEDDSTDLLSQLSYGPTGTRRNAPGNGLLFRAQDGTTVGGTGNVGANTQYFVAVAGGNSSTSASTFNTTGSTNTGSVTLRVREWDVNAPVDPVTAPTAESIAFPGAGGTTTVSASIALGGSKWYSLTVPVDITAIDNTNALQIDNEGSVVGPTANDTGIAVYSSTGVLRASDTTDGTDSIASLSFGSDNRAAPGNGLAYNGRDGVLLAGTYYINVSAGGTPTYGTEFAVSALSAAQSGTVVTNVRYFAPGIDTSSFVAPSTVTDMGDVGTLTPGTEKITDSVPVNFPGDGVARWFKFSIGSEASDATGYYVDVDTNNTSPTTATVNGNIADTLIGAFTNNGLFIASDDDSGVGGRSALSFGDTTPVRAALTGPVGDTAVAGNGRNGVLRPGTYWIGVSTWSTATAYSTGATGWGSVNSTNTPTGNRILTVRTNVPVAPTCICCNPSNVAGPNQSTTPDDSLSADDIIVFLGWFFGNDTRADVAGPNQSTTPDGQFTADDIIVFLSRYFTGC